MKVVIRVPDQNYKAGDVVEASGEQLSALLEGGLAVTQAEWNTQQAVKASDRRSIENAVVRAKERNALPPKDENVLRASLARYDDGKASAEVLVELIDGMSARQDTVMATRTTSSSGLPPSGVEVTGISLEDASKGVLQASQPQDNLIKSGNFREAANLAKEAAQIMKQNHLKVFTSGGDFMLKDVVRAATTTDVNQTATSSLAGDLIIQRNLGYLVYKLPWIGKLTTDLSGEPVRFGQSILTRYIVPPSVLTWVPGVGFTDANDGLTGAQQVSDSGNGSAPSTQAAAHTLRAGASGNYAYDASNAWGIPTKSQPSTPDKSVTLGMFKATEVEFPVSLLAGTIRNLFSEQLGAQTYSLAEEINKYVLTTLLAATWNGKKTEYVKALANWNLAGMIGVKNAMSTAKIPDVGRFCLLHSFYHDKLLEDSNLLSAKAILSLIKHDLGSFENGEIPTLFGVKPLESQLCSATSAGVLTEWTNDAAPETTNIVGFAGNMSSGLFVSRPPQDFTQIATQLGVPVTASVRLMTEPDSGLTVMVFSYADNGKMSLNQRVCLMYGAAQGDPRVGIVIRNATV